MRLERRLGRHHERRAGGHGPQPPGAHAAQNADQHGFGLVVQVMRGRDHLAAGVRGDARQCAQPDDAGRLFQGPSLLPAHGPGLGLPHVKIELEVRGQLAHQGLLRFGLGAQPMVDVAKQDRADAGALSLGEERRQHDRVPAARNRAQNPRLRPRERCVQSPFESPVQLAESSIFLNRLHRPNLSRRPAGGQALPFAMNHFGARCHG